jgi:deoxyribose-phosphate aldolase
MPFVIMLDAICDRYQKDGKRVGIKPAGGIADFQSAMRYYALVEAVLGKQWLTHDLFRIGASRLVDNLHDIS